MGAAERLAAVGYNLSEIAGRPVLRLFKSLPHDLAEGRVHVHPGAYASGIMFITLLLTTVFVPVGLILALIVGPVGLLTLAVPASAFIIGAAYPKLTAVNRASGLEAEVPYTAAYVSVMATGGISPYKSIQRIKHADDLMPNLADEARRVEIDVKAFGIDPVAAVEASARRVPSKEYGDLLLGYASTLRLGGDVSHYLSRKVELLFRERVSKIRIIGERLAMIMEAYIAFSTITALTYYIIFIIARAFPVFEAGFATPFVFFIFVWVVMPVISVGFIYLVEMMQPKYPGGGWPAYKTLRYSSPIIIFSTTVFVLPYIFEFLSPVGQPFMQLITGLRLLLGLPDGYQLSLAVMITMFLSTIPTMITEVRYAREAERTSRGIVSFLRDLVEVRKTGLSPERCITSLAQRPYGGFDKILKMISAKLMLGQSYREVFTSLKKRLYGWISKINVFLLLDVIDVGGGTPETLEALATFGEDTMLLEKERKSTMRPLILLPYVSSLIILGTALIMIQFIKALLLSSGRYFAFNEFLTIFVPPLVFGNIFSGLVAGKVSSERISAGFKHVFILTLITLVAIVIASRFEIQPVV